MKPLIEALNRYSKTRTESDLKQLSESVVFYAAKEEYNRQKIQQLIDMYSTLPDKDFLVNELKALL